MIDRKSRFGAGRIGPTAAFSRTHAREPLASSFSAPFLHYGPRAALLLGLAAIGPVQASAQEEIQSLPSAVSEQQGDLAPKINVAAKADRLLPTPPPPASDTPSKDATVPARLVDSLVQLGVEQRIDEAFAESRMPAPARSLLPWPDTESLVAYASSTDPTAEESTATASLPEGEIDGMVTGAIPPQSTPEAGVPTSSPEDVPAAASLPAAEPEAPLPQRQTRKEQPEPARTAASTQEQATPPQSVEATPESQSGPTLPPSLLPTGEQN